MPGKEGGLEAAPKRRPEDATLLIPGPWAPGGGGVSGLRDTGGLASPLPDAAAASLPHPPLHPAPPPPPPGTRSPALPPFPLATCGVGQIRAFVPRRSPAAPRGAPRANTAERRGSRAAPAPQIFGTLGGGLAGQLRACGRGGG